MSNFVIVFILIFISFLPSSASKERIESVLNNKLVESFQISEDKKLEIKNVPQKLDYKDISVGSSSALFVDRSTGEILFEKNKSTKLPMASTTKLMTAILTIEKLNLSDTITVPNLNTRPLDSVVGLSTGEKIKVSELLHGLLIESGSDTAQTLATASAGSENAFVALMNERASILGLSNTQFTNSVGYDDNGHYSTAEDLIKLARIALLNKDITEIVGKKTYTLKTENGKKYFLSNTNQLLGENIKGIKTGTTFSAGECLISLYNDGEREVIGVLLGSPDRFGETRAVLEWTKKAFLWP